jgi:hypothetical protein
LVDQYFCENYEQKNQNENNLDSFAKRKKLFTFKKINENNSFENDINENN